MLTGLKDVDREVLKHVDDKQLLKICSIDKKTWNEVCDDGFLRRRLSKYLGIDKYKKENESWKQFFLRSIYYISKMKEDFEFEHTSGDFQLQYKLLANNTINSLLKESAERGILSLVKYAVEHGSNIHSFDDVAVRIASTKGHLDVVKYLVEHGANIHEYDNQAFRHAAQYGRLDVLKYLVEQGIDIHVEHDYAFEWAAYNGHLDIVQYLVEHGVDVRENNNFALKFASKNGHIDVVKYLVEHGADIHAEKDLSLRWAKDSNHTEVVKYLQSLM
jgi:ankyrin repeat protein